MICIGIGFGKLAWRGKFGGIEQVIIELVVGRERALSLMPMTAHDRWRAAIAGGIGGSLGGDVILREHPRPLVVSSSQSAGNRILLPPECGQRAPGPVYREPTGSDNNSRPRAEDK